MNWTLYQPGIGGGPGEITLLAKTCLTLFLAFIVSKLMKYRKNLQVNDGNIVRTKEELDISL